MFSLRLRAPDYPRQPPPPPPGKNKTPITPPSPPRPSQGPSPSLLRMYVCSLVLNSEQRAIWASLPFTAGGPRHAQTAASNQHLSSAINELTVVPLPHPLLLTITNRLLPPKTFHTLECGERYAKRLAHFPPLFLVFLRLCRSTPLVFTSGFSLFSHTALFCNIVLGTFLFCLVFLVPVHIVIVM